MKNLKQKIIKKIGQIDDMWMLNVIYKLVCGMTRED